MSIEGIIKVLDEIAEGFEELSAEVCARTDLRAMWEGRAKGIRQAIALIKAHLRSQPNGPLTLEELREMDGEPVYIHGLGDSTESKGNGRMISDYSEEFDRLRRNRVAMSYHKYGPAYKNFGEGRVDALKTAELCLEAFKKDHNTEHLVDAANSLMFRYMYPLLGEYFRATDDSGSVGTVGIPINMER